LGGARTALYAWAWARRHGGQFILRIEDTDFERSTPAAVQAIMDGMAWLNLEWDEGPIFQSQRMDRYRAMIDQMLAKGTAYQCWASPEELDVMREQQRARGEKPRYDGRWRPENASKAGLTPPSGVSPVIRFRNPDNGAVVWDDLVKGSISIANAELDDLVIARADGTPTYNFCVVVDDLDMAITHVIRGDDHVNNTPRQINILRALGGQEPAYGHLPMILGPDGEKLSKRHGATSVVQYDAQGFLPEAMVNYLSRLGWSHGDAEIFDRHELVQWFDAAQISRSPAQLDFDKLRWVNAQWMKRVGPDELARRLMPHLTKRGWDEHRLRNGPALATACALVFERAHTLEELAEWVGLFYAPAPVTEADRSTHLNAGALQAVRALADKFDALPDSDWVPATITATMKSTLAEHQLKMPQLAVPVRLLVFGQAQTPSVDTMLAAMPRAIVLERLLSIAA
jgi:glutamyl-tRNA synthetase